MTKVLVVILVVTAFFVVLKFAASLLVWALHLLFAWGALMVLLAAFCYLVYCCYFRRNG